MKMAAFRKSIEERALSYIQMIRSIQGQYGSKDCYWAATILVHGFMLPQDTALALLSVWNQTNADPPWSDVELRHKLKSASAKPPQMYPRGWLLKDKSAFLGKSIVLPPAHSQVSPPKPKEEREKREAAIKDGGGKAADFVIESPSSASDPLEFLTLLFPDMPLVTLAANKKANGETRFLSEWLHHSFSEMRHVVPNPPFQVWGKTQKGDSSMRALESYREEDRRFFVHESDTGDKDEQSAILRHLAEMVPLVAVVDSGKKSLHGWLYIAGLSEDEKNLLMDYSIRIGADRGLRTLNQMARLPFAVRRETGRVQELLYLDPSPLS